MSPWAHVTPHDHRRRQNLDDLGGDKVDGLTEVGLRLNDEEAVIFRRGLMRLAELLLDAAAALDADSLQTMRTPAQRRHDAFMLLVERIVAAAEQDR